MGTSSRKLETAPNPVALHGYVPHDVALQPGERLHIDMRPGARQAPAAAPPTPITVEMHDARVLQTASGCAPADFFKQYSFVLLDHQTAMSESGWSEWGEVASVYAAEVDALVTEELRVDGMVRVNTSGSVAIRRGPGADGYGTGVHQDYGVTPDDFEANLAAFTAGTPHGSVAGQWREKFDADRVRGFAMINFWRPIRPMQKPLESMPLAVCDPRTVSPDDLVPSALLGFTPSGVPTVYLTLKYSPTQRWYYYPTMTTDEVLVFKNFEYFKGRDEDGSIVRSCFHTAFTDPGTPQTAEPRHSAEYRVEVWF